jgi:hypothetical protein
MSNQDFTDHQVDFIARQTYAAYGKTTEFKNFQGNPMPTFDALPERIQQAWRSASLAAHRAAVEARGWLAAFRGRGWVVARVGGGR